MERLEFSLFSSRKTRAKTSSFYRGWPREKPSPPRGRVKLDNFSFQHCKLFGTSSVGGGYLRSSLPTHPLSYTRLLRLSCFNLFLSSPSDRPPTKQLSLPSFFSKMSSFFAASFFYSFERLKSASITTLPLFIYYIYASPSYIFEIIELFSML